MSGTSGARNGRFASGLVRRITSTAPHTMTKANSAVPSLDVKVSRLTSGASGLSGNRGGWNSVL